MHEKAKRIKEIRLLEKFFTKTISLLKMADFDELKFKEKTIKNFESLKKNQSEINIELNSNYLKALKIFIDLTYQKVYSKDLQVNTKEILLKEANSLQKEKNKKSYKKHKHKHKSFEDGN